MGIYPEKSTLQNYRSNNLRGQHTECEGGKEMQEVHVNKTDIRERDFTKTKLNYSE